MAKTHQIKKTLGTRKRPIKRFDETFTPVENGSAELL
jgi:hypothetical protein